MKKNFICLFFLFISNLYFIEKCFAQQGKSTLKKADEPNPKIVNSNVSNCGFLHQGHDIWLSNEAKSTAYHVTLSVTGPYAADIYLKEVDIKPNSAIGLGCSFSGKTILCPGGCWRIIKIVSFRKIQLFIYYVCQY